MNANLIVNLLLDDTVVVAGKASKRSREFDKLLSKLPSDVQNLAREVFAQWRANPFDPSLEFKKLTRAKSWWSIRLGRRYRAICYAYPDTWYWRWVGTHEDYNAAIMQIEKWQPPSS
jgi:mRNA-degrading endonuclease RelE of RelBE toxin-antitoxin system